MRKGSKVHEKEIIESSLMRNRWHRGRTAASLGIDQEPYTRMKEYGLDLPKVGKMAQTILHELFQILSWNMQYIAGCFSTSPCDHALLSSEQYNFQLLIGIMASGTRNAPNLCEPGAIHFRGEAIWKLVNAWR